jgi:hypothetical protein
MSEELNEREVHEQLWKYLKEETELSFRNRGKHYMREYNLTSSGNIFLMSGASPTKYWVCFLDGSDSGDWQTMEFNSVEGVVAHAKDIISHYNLRNSSSCTWEWRVWAERPIGNVVKNNHLSN